MKHHFPKQLFTAAALTLVFFSCKKSSDLTGNVPTTGEEATVVPKLAATPKLVKITSDFIPVTTFTYDTKGRISSATDEYQTTYTYGKGTVTIKTTNLYTAAIRSLMTGKLNGKGYLVDLEGYLIEDEIRQDKKYVFNYDAAGQMIQMDVATTVENVTSNLSVKCTWKDGNLVKQTQTLNGNPGLEWQYTYDAAKKDLTGLRNQFIDAWSDTFLGKRNTNHVSSIFLAVDGKTDKYSDNNWTFNANGYATASVATMYSGSYTYTVSSNYFYQ